MLMLFHPTSHFLMIHQVLKNTPDSMVNPLLNHTKPLFLGVLEMETRGKALRCIIPPHQLWVHYS